jgi:glucose-6-phosphate dehydrogenase assembly protein OpcA
VIVLRLRGEPGAHLGAVVMPLLLADAPVVVWWPAERPIAPALDPLGRLASRRITDAAASDRRLPEPAHRRGQLELLARGYTPGDTDLAWTRLTPWRAQLAAALELEASEEVTSATVTGPPFVASALMAAWLEWRLGAPVRLEETDGDFLAAVELHFSGGRRVLLDKGLDESQARLRVTGQVDRVVALGRRNRAESLGEELRRLEPDEFYGELARQAIPAFLASRFAPADGDAAGSGRDGIGGEDGAGRDGGGGG